MLLKSLQARCHQCIHPLISIICLDFLYSQPEQIIWQIFWVEKSNIFPPISFPPVFRCCWFYLENFLFVFLSHVTCNYYYSLLECEWDKSKKCRLLISFTNKRAIVWEFTRTYVSPFTDWFDLRWLFWCSCVPFKYC